MGHHQQKSSSSGPLIALILLLGFLFLVAVMVVGVGGYMFLRQARAQRHAEIAHARAREAQLLLEKAKAIADAQSNFQQARQRADAKFAEMAQTVDAYTSDERLISIHIDQHGALTLRDQSIDLDALRTELHRSSEYGSTNVKVAIRVDKQCRFEHVAEILALCEDLGIADVSVAGKP